MASDSKVNEEETSAAADETSSQEPCPTGGGSIFDNLDELRKRQDFDRLIDVKSLLTSVPVGKPTKQMFFQVLPGDKWQLTAALLDWEEDGTKFFVSPSVYPELPAEFKRVQLRTAVTPQGSVRLWPIRLPNPDGSDNEWFVSAREVAAKAEGSWIRMVANREARGYDVFQAKGDFGDPTIPEQSFQDLLKLAFAGKVIDNLDHPVIVKLLGGAR
jgi:hypothetical protein